MPPKKTSNQGQSPQTPIQNQPAKVNKQAVKKTAWPAFSPVVSIVLVVVVALIAGMGLYYLNTKTKNTNNSTSIKTNANANVNSNSNTNCGHQCVQWVQPTDDFCPDGTIVGGAIDDCGCRMAPRCDRSSTNANANRNANTNRRFCGGIAGIACPEGYRCEGEDNDIIADGGGNCVPIDTVNTNANANINVNTNLNSNRNTNQPPPNPIEIPDDWLTYTNNTYGYSIQYSPEYTPSGTSESYQFRKGLLRGDPTETFTVNTQTAANHTQYVDGTIRGEGWYDWALGGFPLNDNGQSNTEPRFSDQRQVTYGTNTFMVFNDDAFGTNNLTYFLVHGDTVYVIDDWRVGTFSENIVQAMLASFKVN